MANAITLAKIFVPILDKVYKNASLTSVLDGNPELVRQGANYNELIIPKISMQGLGDYSRNGGYVNGDVTLTNETVKCNFDRGRMFSVDNMDNQESVGIAFGQLGSEFLRTKVVPELDAFRFASYAGTTGISKISAGATLADGAAVIAALRAGVNKMDEDEVDANNRYLFITPTLYGMIRDMDTTKSKEVLEGFAGVIKVPQSRFYTAIDQYDGTTSGEEAGGYVKDSTSGCDINFMIIEKSAVIQFEKHVAPKIITPEQNQNADAYKFGYRNVGIADVYENKTAGIYLHYKAKA
nr:MAG TPA: Major capsid protein [Caudoviricetes sp.]